MDECFSQRCEKKKRRKKHRARQIKNEKMSYLVTVIFFYGRFFLSLSLTIKITIMIRQENVKRCVSA